MKKNIVVCCEDMFMALNRKILYFDFGVWFLKDDAAGVLPAIKVCPFCGKELPFPFEEAE